MKIFFLATVGALYILSVKASCDGFEVTKADGIPEEAANAIINKCCHVNDSQHPHKKETHGQFVACVKNMAKASNDLTNKEANKLGNLAAKSSVHKEHGKKGSSLRGLREREYVRNHEHHGHDRHDHTGRDRHHRHHKGPSLRGLSDGEDIGEDGGAETENESETEDESGSDGNDEDTATDSNGELSSLSGGQRSRHHSNGDRRDHHGKDHHKHHHQHSGHE